MASPSKLLRVLVLADLHALRVILGIAAIMVAFDMADMEEYSTIYSLTRVAPAGIWGLFIGLTGATQLFLVNRGYVHTKDATAFALWMTLMWLFITLNVVFNTTMMPSPYIALTLGALWVFLRSGLPVGGHRKADFSHSDRG